MCQSCDVLVAACGEALDAMIAADREAREESTDMTSQECTIRLTNVILGSFNDLPDKNEALRDMAMGLALAVTRLIAAQEIYGMPS
jgi:hypothetical protein